MESDAVTRGPPSSSDAVCVCVSVCVRCMSVRCMSVHCMSVRQSCRLYEILPPNLVSTDDHAPPGVQADQDCYVQVFGS